MRVLVTGGAGRLGRWALRELVEHGHEVVGADRVLPRAGEDRLVSDTVRFREVDLADVGQVAGAMAGCDAVVHLGAIPAPYRHPDEVVFANNTRATFGVLQAAALLGVRKAVIASSVSALGTAYAVSPFMPLHAPVDEEHPLLGQDPYALSKEVDERTAAMFHRRAGMSVVALRFHWIALPGEAAARAAEFRDRPQTWAHLFWGYVDVRDAARACRLGVEADVLGFEAFNITAADTLMEAPTEELIRQHCPQVKLRQRIEGTASGWSIEKARWRLGYEPRHSWRHDDSVA
jgi:nucleoside-diphosphate-sugar epimerase